MIGNDHSHAPVSQISIGYADIFCMRRLCVHGGGGGGGIIWKGTPMSGYARIETAATLNSILVESVVLSMQIMS